MPLFGGGEVFWGERHESSGRGKQLFKSAKHEVGNLSAAPLAKRLRKKPHTASTTADNNTDNITAWYPPRRGLSATTTTPPTKMARTTNSLRFFATITALQLLLVLLAACSTPARAGFWGPSAVECGCSEDPESFAEGLETLGRMGNMCTKEADAKSCLATCAEAGMEVRKSFYVGCLAQLQSERNTEKKTPSGWF